MPYTTSGTHNGIAQDNQNRLISSFEHGELKPFFLWHLLILFGLPLFGLMTLRYRYLRFAVIAVIYSVGYDLLNNRRSLIGANGCLQGIVTSYWMTWSTVLLVFNRPEKDFKRIERRTISASVSIPDESDFIDMDRDGDIHATDNGNGTIPSKDFKHSGTQSDGTQFGKVPLSQNEVFTWQPYPEHFLHRLNWSLDLLTNMRGAQWNWRISPVGPLPASVHAQLNPGKRDTSREVDDPEVMDTGTRLKNGFETFWISYFALDLLKVLAIRDPYFKGVVSPSPPPPFPFNHLPDIPILISIHRYVLTGFGIFFALQCATSLSPIIFLGLSTAFPNAARKVTSAPLDAPWLYSESFGPFLPTVFEQGLAGCWAQWWHQLFRAGFTNTGRWILSTFLPTKLSSSRNVRRVVMTLVAFTLSGIIHAGGSFSQFADTNPLAPFTFFILQALGIILEDTFKRLIVPALISPSRIPRWMKYTGNTLFVIFWIFSTCGLVSDDFARGGVWITEPVPFSLLRGLGVGVDDTEKVWCTWRVEWFRKWEGKRWWDRGTVVL